MQLATYFSLTATAASLAFLCASAPANSKPANSESITHCAADDGEIGLKLSLGKERVFYRDICFEEQFWGAYQFPRPYKLGDRLVGGGKEYIPVDWSYHTQIINISGKHSPYNSAELFRSNWYGTTVEEWSFMYMSRSKDMVKSWPNPENSANTGTLPCLCRLDCGVALLYFARPKIFVRALLNISNTKWSRPHAAMTQTDRIALANIIKNSPNFHVWDGACNNPEIVANDKNTALLFYSDFSYPDENGAKRKSIFCRKIRVEISPRYKDSTWNGKNYRLPAPSEIKTIKFT